MFSMIQDQNSFNVFEILTIEKSSPVSLSSFPLFSSILWALFCTCIQMPFYMGCCIYILGQAFLTWSFFNFLYTWSSPVLLLFSYTIVCQYVCVCHISFSGEGLEFKKTHNFWFLFLYLNVHTFGHLKREETVWLFSQCIFVQIYIESGGVNNRCV